MFNIILISDIKVAEKPMFRSESDKCGLEKCHLGALVTMMTMAMAIVLDDDDGGDDDDLGEEDDDDDDAGRNQRSWQPAGFTVYRIPIGFHISPVLHIQICFAAKYISILHILFHTYIFFFKKNISFV